MASFRYEVFLTSDAKADLQEIVDYIETHDSLKSADIGFDQIKTAILNLERFPSRGRVVTELKEVGVSEYREIVVKPYRIVYFVSGRLVPVVAIFDGRRDLEDVLTRRLLR